MGALLAALGMGSSAAASAASAAAAAGTAAGSTLASAGSTLGGLAGSLAMNGSGALEGIQQGISAVDSAIANSPVGPAYNAFNTLRGFGPQSGGQGPAQADNSPSLGQIGLAPGRGASGVGAPLGASLQGMDQQLMASLNKANRR